MTAKEVSRLTALYGDDVYRFVRRLYAGSVQDAEDLYQQTFLSLLEHNYKIRQEQNPRAFLFFVAYRLYKSEVRKRARRASIAPFSSFEDLQEAIPSDSSAPEESAVRSWEARLLVRCVNLLPDKFRIPVLLHYTFELPLEEIAKTMKIPKGTVKSRLYKAKELLRKELSRYGYDS